MMESEEKASMENWKRIELENLHLKSQLVHLEAQVNESFHLKLQKVIVDKKLSALQAERLQDQKRIRKLRIRISELRKEVADEDMFLQNIEWHIKKIWILLLEYGNRLGNNDLLTSQEKNELRKEYEEWVTLMVTLDKGETKEVFKMLNEFPVNLFEVINSSENEFSELNPSSFSEIKIIPSNYSSTLTNSQVSSNTNSTNDSEDTLQSDLDGQSLVTSDSSISSLSSTLAKKSANIRNKEQLSEEIFQQHSRKTLTKTNCNKVSKIRIEEKSCRSKLSKLRDQINRCKTTLIKRSNVSSNSTSVFHLQSNTIDLNDNFSTVQSPSENKRKTILLNEPSMKIFKRRTTQKIDAELPKVNNFYFPSKSTTEITQSPQLQDSKPNKRKNSVLNAGTLNIAPARVRGRTLQNRAITGKQITRIENFKSTTDEFDCNIDLSKIEQHFENESADTQREAMAQDDFIAIDKPKKMRKNNRNELEKTCVDDGIENNEDNVDKTTETLVKSSKISNIATETFDYTILQSQMSSHFKYLNKPKSVPNMLKKDKVLPHKVPFKHSKHVKFAHNSIPKSVKTRKNRSKSQHKPQTLKKDFVNNLSGTKESDCSNKIQVSSVNKISTSIIKNSSYKNIEHSLVNNETSKNIMSDDTSYTQKHSRSQQDIVTQFSFNIPCKNEGLDQTNLRMFSANEENKFSTSEATARHEAVDAYEKGKQNSLGGINDTSHVFPTVKNFDNSESCVNSEEKQVKITEKNTVSKKPSSLSDSDSESPLVIDEDNDDETIAFSEKVINEEVSKKRVSFNIPKTEIALEVSEAVNARECIKSGDEKVLDRITTNISNEKEYYDYPNCIPTSSKEDIKPLVLSDVESSKVEIDIKYKPDNVVNARKNSSVVCINKNPMFGPENPLHKFFLHEFRKIQFNQENFEQNVENLFLLLMDVSKTPDISVLLFHVLNYLHLSKDNVIYSYSECEDLSVLFPLDENCIATTLSLIDLENPSHLGGLLNTAVTTFHHLIISKKKFNMLGLASLCRVFTQICKCQGNKMKPVLLCGDLLKMKHKFATYLIASITGVWKELFQNGGNLSDEEVLFHSSILYGASKKTTAVNGSNWHVSMDIISKYITALPVNNAKVAINMLKEQIQLRCKDDPCNNQYLASALIILAGHEEWEWTKENVIDKFIVPNLTQYGSESLNENAFDLYSNMYVDALLLQPGNPLDTVLTKFFDSTAIFEGGNSVQDSAALALMRFVYRKNRNLPLFLVTWFKNNDTKPKVQQIKPYFQRRVMGKHLNKLHEEDVLFIH